MTPTQADLGMLDKFPEDSSSLPTGPCRILVVTNLYPSATQPTYGVFVKNSVEGLSQVGCDIVRVVAIKGRGKTLIGRLLKYLSFYISVLGSGITLEYDLLYVHYPPHCALAVLALQSLKKRKLVVNIHGSDVGHEIVPDPTIASRVLFRLTDALLKKASLIVVPSSYFESVVRRKFRIKEDIVYVSPSGGVDPQQGIEDERNTARRAYGLTGEFVMGYVSRLDQDKRWDVFLRAARLFADSHFGIKLRLVVVGDGVSKGEFLQLADKLGLNLFLSYLGAKRQSELREVFSLMDVFVFPTMKESLGLVGLEAMACGIPVIGSRIGALVEYIKDNENGFLFNPGDYRELATLLARYHKLPRSERVRLSRNAFQTSLSYDRRSINSRLANRLWKL